MVSRFGAYEILYELKSGGMGSVLLARRRGPGAFEQLVAIKTIRAEHAGSAIVRAMFLDEARILAGLTHPGIATVHDFGEEGATLYMAMEYVAGIPFRELTALRPPPIVVARAIAEACRGLHAAHELRDLSGNLLGLVHRDISPDNLLVGFDGHVKVIDFGIALVKNRQAPVTEFGMLKGKPPYMSPEQLKNEAMDRRSDVFSLAIVLWELLAGKPLFEGDSLYSIAYAVENMDISPPSKLRGEELPIGLDAAVMNALDRDPDRRMPTAAAFAEQLEQVIQASAGETLEAWAERALEPQRAAHRAWIAGVTSGLAVPKSLGRATGSMTELAPLGQPPIAAATPMTTRTSVEQSTSLGGKAQASAEPEEDELDFAPRRRLAPIALLFLVLLGGGVALYVVLHHHPDAIVATHDASPSAPDAPIVVVRGDAAAPDAPPPPPVDAAVGHIDAGRARPVHGDAGRSPRDAAVVAMAIDAALPTGTATVTINPKGGGASYSNIVIDNGPPVAPPVNHKKLTAGRHKVQFLDPKTGEVLDTQVIDVVDGQVLTVMQR